MTRLIVATQNVGKLIEIKNLFAHTKTPWDEIIGLDEVSFNQEILENGQTFFDNALIKAKAVAKSFAADWILADDSGLEVDALNGQPGVYSARYKKDHDDQANMQKVLDNLKDEKNRNAHFTTAMVLISPKKDITSGTGKTDGKITLEKIGSGGHGYDPIFYSEELNKTFAQATIEEKNSVSHRTRALNDIFSKLFPS